MAGARAKPFPMVTESALMMTEVGWLLVTTTDLVPLVLPSATAPKASPVDDKVMGSTPFAVKVTCCGLFMAVVSMVRFPGGSGPRTPGSTVTAMVHEFPGARLPGFGQLLPTGETANGPGGRAYELMVIADASVFLTLMVSGRLFSRTATLPKL